MPISDSPTRECERPVEIITIDGLGVFRTYQLRVGGRTVRRPKADEAMFRKIEGEEDRAPLLVRCGGRRRETIFGAIQCEPWD
ncbi:MAG: hypothetical protein CMJ23_07180 [Phycisphaerae bacterium]|nr:hypothetical protein [Phycisphaerae bacterium]